MLGLTQRAMVRNGFMRGRHRLGECIVVKNGMDRKHEASEQRESKGEQPAWNSMAPGKSSLKNCKSSHRVCGS